MSMAYTKTGVEDELGGCIIVSIDTPKCTYDSVVYRVMYKPTRNGDIYRHVSYDTMCYLDPCAPITHRAQMPAVLNATGGHLIPQNVRQARTLADFDKWLDAEEEGMTSIQHIKVIACTSSYPPNGVGAITTMFVSGLKWTLMNTIQRHKARWAVRGLIAIPNMHCNPGATRAPVASDSFFLVMIHIVVKHNSYFNQFNGYTAF